MKNDDSLKLREKYHIMEDWFVPILDQLEKVKLDEYPDSIFWVNENNKKIYMQYNKKTKRLYVDYNRIWSYFYKNYSHDYMEVRKLIQGLVGEHLNLWGISIIPTRLRFHSGGGRTSKFMGNNTVIKFPVRFVGGIIPKIM